MIPHKQIILLGITYFIPNYKDVYVGRFTKDITETGVLFPIL